MEEASSSSSSLLVAGNRDSDLSQLPLSGLTVTSTGRLTELRQTVSELTKQIEEFWSSGEFQLKQKRQDGENSLSLVRESRLRELQSLRAVAESLELQLGNNQTAFQDQLHDIEHKLVEKVKILEISYQKKLIHIVEQYQNFNILRQAKHKEWTVQWNKTKQRVETQLLETLTTQEAEITSNVKQNERIAEEKKIAREIELETIRQLQQDSAQEISMLRTQYETKLTDERNDKVRLRGVGGIHRKHHEDLKKFLLQKDEELKAVQEECRILAEKIELLNRNKATNIQNIKLKDHALAEKEATILAIKKQNIELEKFKFVLDHKIKTLKNEIEPKNSVIQDMRDEIKHMDNALEVCHANNKQLHADIAQLQGDHDELKRTLDKTKLDINCHVTLIKNFKFQFGNLVDNHYKDALALISEFRRIRPAFLPADVNALVAAASGAGKELPETQRQRDFLEKAVKGLKTVKTKKPEVLHQNIALIAEIEDLRRSVADMKNERAQRKVELRRLMPV